MLKSVSLMVAIVCLTSILFLLEFAKTDNPKDEVFIKVVFASLIIIGIIASLFFVAILMLS